MTTLSHLQDEVLAGGARRTLRKLDQWEHNLRANLERYQADDTYSAETIASVQGQLSMLEAVREVLS